MAKSAVAENPLPAVNILLVEDDPSDAFIIDNLLKDSGNAPYQTHHVKTQSEAILALKEQPFDACLLDLTLPDSTGFSALIDIQEKAPDMPVLVLTGLNNKTLAKGAVGRGAQDYLLKDELKMKTLARSIDYARQRKRIEKELFQRANYDALTGLANRNLFETRLKMALARAERTGTGVAILFIDLDHFKAINDTHGHEAGDIVLKNAALRIKDVLRAYDTPARLGGDEFAVLLEGIASPRDAAIIAQKILREFLPPVRHGNKMLTIAASIGVTFSDASMPVKVMLHNADTAMYSAKKDGGGSYRFCTPEIQDKTESDFKARDELLEAISRHQLRLYYQPYISPNGEAVLGIEALLRWAHPTRGMLQPGEFLGLAEENKLMPELGKWMFSKLREDITAWTARNVPPLEIAFNLSASQLDATGFIDWVTPIAKPEFLHSHRLVAEIESDALAALTEARFLLLTRMREMGILLHLDHFGHGPVLLQSLHTLPFSLMKLDLSLIQRMDDKANGDAMIRTAIELAHQLGMKVGAVGVEMPWQMQSLKAQQCDTLQGFLIGPPMTAEQLVKWLTEKR